MNVIEITFKSLEQRLTIDSESQFRSLEKQLEILNREYNVNDYSKVITVKVVDKADAIILSERLGLIKVHYIENGVAENLQIKVVKKPGRPRNIVRMSGVDKSMSARQLDNYLLEELQKTHLQKSQILKAKLITKAQLERYVADGTLKEVVHGTKIFIERESFIKLLKLSLLTLCR
jgi:hypothetical protein